MADQALSRRERQRLETRADLVAAAHAIVKDEGYEALTIRKLAERVGMATMSVYSYFADKQAILMAVAEDTFDVLARRVEQKMPADPIEALRVGLREFVAFGLENPNEYQTIFMTPQLHEHEEKEMQELQAGNPALQGMLRAVNAAIAAGEMRGDALAIATMLWTVSHGAISLILTFPKYGFGDPLTYAGRVIDMAISSLAQTDVAPLSATQPAC